MSEPNAPKCKKCYDRGTTGMCYRCPVWPVWHYFCDCPAGDDAKLMYGPNVGPNPDFKHEFVALDVDDKKFCCKHCGLYPENTTERDCTEDERKVWRQIKDFMGEPLYVTPDTDFGQSDQAVNLNVKF